MVVGHTKFTPDSCFGLLKQRFRRTHVQCLSDLKKVIDESAEVNQAKLVGNEQGDIYVPTYVTRNMIRGLLRIFGEVELRIPLERATLTEYFDACYVSI